MHIFMNYVFNLQWIKLPVSREVAQIVEAMLPSSTASSDSPKTEVQQQAGKPVPAPAAPRHCILMEPITGLMCDIWGAVMDLCPFWRDFHTALLWLWLWSCLSWLPYFPLSLQLLHFSQHGQGAFPEYFPWPWWFVLASEPFPLPSSAQKAPPRPGPHPALGPCTLPTTPGAATLAPQSTATGSCLPPASVALPRPSPLHLPPKVLRQLQRKSAWAECNSATLLRRRVIMWLLAFPKGWCLSTHWCDDFLHAPSLLWPTPGAYLQSGSYSLSLLPNWNKFTQLQLEGLQTMHFLFPFLGKNPLPWGPRSPIISVIPNCSSGWLHSQPASTEMLQFFI